MANSARRTTLGILLVSAGLICSLPTLAQTSAWPDKPVRLVVPYSAGGTTDFAARLIAQKLTKLTGKSFFVENKTGGSGTIATQEVVRSAPDGSTLLVTDTTYAMLPLVFAKLPWDHMKDLVHITELIETPVMLTVPERSPFKTVAELVAFAKANPGKLNFGSGGPGSSTHLGAELFKSVAGVSITHIPYRGAGAAAADLLAGQIDMLVAATPTSIAQVKGGRVRALAVSGSERIPALPAVPTFAEAGLPDYKGVSWFGLATPRGTSPAIVAKLHDLVATAMRDPEVQRTFAQQGAVYRPMSVEAFGRFVNQEIVIWAQVGEKAGVKPE
ncbi:Bug family tripartite tricarboxylate transporter substrate binding protein [Cupriavidus nantongensis]|uniref:ABC transporter substrate-binding protein n=1 Tax=Cupriavidus nantongensis TaxID=1796606 RepID=A0A142JR28_9BURK|nr:tripartite tricarboxylate transporter substrate binding protein [Cupriavidus nantongensis]AMR80540.1 ABC transporter substrate-binding protein [Cupriavidus nantongensis]